MLKKILGLIIYWIAPIHSGAKYCQLVAARNTAPSILLPQSLAKIISQECYALAKTISTAMKIPLAIEFEGVIINATCCAIDLIQGVEDDVFDSRSQAARAFPWLESAITSSGIEIKGIRSITIR